MTLREEIKAKQAELVALKARIEADDAEAIAEGEKLQAEIDTKTAELQQAEKKAALLGKIGSTDRQEDTAMGEVKQARTLGEHFVNHVKAQENVGEKFTIAAPLFKAYNDIQKTPTTEGVSAYATTFDRNVVTGPRIDLVVRDLFGAETISGSTLTYLVEGDIEGAPAATNEAAAKARVHFKDPAIKTVSLDKITAYIKESEEYIHDYAFLASAINGRLLYELQLKIQNKLIYDLLNTSGIQSDSTNWGATAKASDLADLIYGASMDVREETGFAADGILINPVDWKTIRLGKDGEDRYYGGGYFGDGRPDNVWNIPVCISTAVDAGTIVVGAFKTCGSVVNSEGVRIESTNTDQDDFIKNLMTIRCEERLALAVRRPKGFKVLTKVTGATGATGQ